MPIRFVFDAAHEAGTRGPPPGRRRCHFSHPGTAANMGWESLAALSPIQAIARSIARSATLVPDQIQCVAHHHDHAPSFGVQAVRSTTATTAPNW